LKKSAYFVKILVQQVRRKIVILQGRSLCHGLDQKEVLWEDAES